MVIHVRRTRDPIIVGLSLFPLAFTVAWWARGRQDWCYANIIGHYFS
jgi:hypothetical protein